MSHYYDVLKNALPSITKEIFAEPIDMDSRPGSVRLVKETGQCEQPGEAFSKITDEFCHGPKRRFQFDATSPGQQEFLRVVQRLFISTSRAPRVVVFTGVDRFSDPTQISFVAGQALAASVDASVCVVDANSMAPSIHSIVKAQASPGLLEATENGSSIRQVAVQVDDANLWVIPFGESRATTAGLFTSDRFDSRMLELRHQFDYVIISAPVASSVETAVLGQKSDGVVLIIEANSTRKDAALSAKNALEAANVMVFGAVLNNRTYPVPNALYRKL